MTTEPPDDWCHDIEVMRLQCTQCPKVFFSQKGFDKHARLHLDPLNIFCQYRNEDTLAKHMTKRHDQYRPQVADGEDANVPRTVTNKMMKEPREYYRTKISKMRNSENS